MSKLSRRSFLKGTAVSALGAAALGMTACSNNTAASSTASSAAASAPASSTPAQQPAAAETGKPGFFTDPYQYKDTDAVQVVTTEVVVVGAGNAGCTAACSCVENGSEVVVIEAQNAIHGQGGGVGLCNTKYVQSLVDEGKLPHMTDVVEHQNIWVQRCGSRVNEALVSMWFNNSPEAGNWLIDKCAEFGVVPVSFRAHAPNAIIPESYDYHMFVNVGDHQFDSKCGYFAATNVLYEDSQNAEKYEHPATYFFNTKAQELLVEDGRVTGVFAQRDGELWLFRATKGVILATGDYMNNEAMVKRWCPDVDGYDKKQYQKTGDGHIMAIDAGAKMENLGHTKMMHDFDSGLMYEEPFLYVNMEGKRFCNEDTGFVYMGNITKYLPRYNGANVDANHPDGSLGWYCQVYDSDYMSYANSPVPEQVMTKYIPGAVENPQGVFTNLIDTYKADTIEELAALLDVPADELQKTIDRYNELCDQGTDADFGKKSAYMHKIEKAPFWGVRKHIRVSSIDSGVNTNANGQALDADGKVIEGLYCVGNVGGVFYGGADYPFHQTGLSLGRCYTFGMLAAKHAMGQL